ncbi:MAG TPA: FkbM family methyltransferase [Pyrinomonadaceae bacterium]|nr:FkbM family methyltransferase [Pyrinomonadaceae bacterium]
MRLDSHRRSDTSAVSERALRGERLSFWVRIPRVLYGRLNVRRGVGRAVMTLAKFNPALRSLPVPLNDGRILYLDLREPMCMNYLLAGEIWMEQGPTKFVRCVLHAGEVAIDIGANVGWYSTLFSEQVGRTGRVYGFEPSTKACGLVTRTASAYPQLEIVNSALSDYEGKAELHLPAFGEMASLQSVPGELRAQECRVTTLDAFLKSRGKPVVHYVKCDAEGAELAILRGAAGLLASERPPIWQMEINAPTAARFGYHPDRIFEYFQSFAQAGYEAYKINAESGMLTPLVPPVELVRDDAVIVPRWQADRLAAYLRALNAPAQATSFHL